jgi:UDP-N-acetylmuramoyl-L-alanyl-D-glutamate--2,6-diaminopimelate ligase
VSTLEAEARTIDGMTLADVAREVPGKAKIEGSADVRVFGVQNDSRNVTGGDLFVVRKGEQHDGRAFVEGAIAAGAVAILAAHDLALDPVTVPVLRVPDAAVGLAYASAAVYGHPAFSLDIVGISGTNGKTTTSYLVRAVVDGVLGTPRCGVVGTVGHTYASRTVAAAHTTPESDELARVLAVMRKRGATHIAMEVSSIALVLRRVEAVRFRVAAFTNLTQDHLDFHGSMDAYAAAKMELFTRMAPGLAVVNVDDAFGARIAAAAKCNVIRVGKSGDLRAENVTTHARGMNVRVRHPSGVVEIETRLVGAHNVENLLVALGIAYALDLDLERAAAALARESGAPGRLERCDEPGDDVTVLVDYAHTPDALGRVLDAIRGAGRTICVFGCGGDRDPTKRGPMGEAVAARADVAIITSDNPRTEDPAAIAAPVEAGARRAGLEPIVELDRRRAIEHAIAIARSGDTILVAGKGHEDYQIIGTEKRPFDDRVEARRALALRRARG